MAFVSNLARLFRSPCLLGTSEYLGVVCVALDSNHYNQGDYKGAPGSHLYLKTQKIQKKTSPINFLVRTLNCTEVWFFFTHKLDIFKGKLKIFLLLAWMPKRSISSRNRNFTDSANLLSRYSLTTTLSK